ncbi:FkbM family methyltransferase [Variovorax gossypii]
MESTSVDAMRAIKPEESLAARLERVMNEGHENDGNDAALASEVSSRLIALDPELLGLFQENLKLAEFAIRYLSAGDRREAVLSLIGNLQIPPENRSLLQTAVDVGLQGDSEKMHQWILEDDIVRQRLEVIRDVVLPYIETHCPERKAFHALKVYEGQSLISGQSLVSARAIYELIAKFKSKIESNSFEFEKLPEPKQSAVVRVAFTEDLFRTMLRLAWASQEYLFELHERYEPEEFIAALERLKNIVPVCLIPTHLGYPMGGGESFIHQTCRVLNEFAVKCVWMSFVEPGVGWYKKDYFVTTPYYIDIRRSGECTEEAILTAVEKFRPEIIHAHGGTADLSIKIAKENRLTAMIGYHFWDGLIELGSTKNSHILENIDQHRLSESSAQGSPLIYKYVASEFMLEVYRKLAGTEPLNVVHPISDGAQYAVEREGDGTFVLQINTCVLKGGKIFLDCVKNLGNEIPFMGIQSEPDSPEFNANLSEEMARHPRSQLRSYGNVRDFYRSARMVLVPTLVDETFCRVAFEAAMNGIPVISTANGFLRQMLGETGVFLSEDSSDWIAKIEELYFDIERLREIGEKQRARLIEIFGGDSGRFVGAAMHLIDNSSTRNIGMFTVWGDQGIGNLSHTHAKVLRKIGYKVHIFSAQPYAAIGRALLRQANPEDWDAPANADSVHYSLNHREAVTVHELTQFILINKIHTLIVPEVCWQPNWDRLFALKVKGLEICSIPMIEIVIRDEIPNHNRLTSTLYCTRLAQDALNAAGITNGAFLGYGFGTSLSKQRIDEKRRRLQERGKIRYLHVAGHNPQTRKNTPQVIEAFSQALKIRDDIELTVTSMDPLGSYYPYEIPDGIHIVDKSLSRTEIHQLYEEHDASIQVSSHEGLGLGFYESICHSTPILSLDATPHNEIVLEGRTGWLIPASPTPIPDNSEAIVEAWRFETSDLTSRIVLLERDDIDRAIVTTGQTFKSQFDEFALLSRFIETLPRPAAPRTLAAFIGQGQAGEAAHGAGESSQPADPAAVMPAPALAGWKPRAKRILRRAARNVYQLAKPVTRILARKLRQLMVEASADIRSEVQALREDLHSGRRESRPRADDSRAVATPLRAVAGTDDPTRLQILALTRSVSLLSRQVEGQLIAQDARKATVGRLARDTEFVKRRLASYAGDGVVLTYLRDESPIFVNTGDLGCPSPIVNGGVWEPENLSVLYSFLTPTTVFLDVGANIGYFSIAIGNRLKRGGRVFSFEPHSKLTNLIERSVQLNGLEAVVRVLQCAVSDEEGMLDLFYPDDHLGKGSTARNANEQGKTLRVPAHRVDNLVDKSLTVDLIKIDVEGHELPVLRGMVDIFARSPRIKVLFEKLESGTSDTESIGEFFRERGLSLYGVGPHAVLVLLSAEGYTSWIGDVLAAPAGDIDRLARTSFSVFPGSLFGEGEPIGQAVTRYAAKEAGILFFGPDWC